LIGFNDDGSATFILPAYSEGDRQLDFNQHAAEQNKDAPKAKTEIK
jgi:hypothetical protein